MYIEYFNPLAFCVNASIIDITNSAARSLMLFNVARLHAPAHDGGNRDD